jgi:hypothetical protein
MFIEFTMDQNVTFKSSVEFLKSIGLIGDIEKGIIYKEDKNLYFSIEVNKSEKSETLQKVTKNSLYCSCLDEKGITLFSIDNSDLTIFIPMHNILSITNNNK